MMDLPVLKGLSFGLTSAIITTLALIVGLDASTHSRAVVIGGILIMAIADALSDSFSMHMAEESARKKPKFIWKTMMSTFFFKFIFSMTFLVPVILLELSLAVIVSIIWGLGLITSYSYYLARREGGNLLKIILEHLLLTLIVIMISYYVGLFVSTFI